MLPTAQYLVQQHRPVVLTDNSKSPECQWPFSDIWTLLEDVGTSSQSFHMPDESNISAFFIGTRISRTALVREQHIQEVPRVLSWELTGHKLWRGTGFFGAVFINHFVQ